MRRMFYLYPLFIYCIALQLSAQSDFLRLSETRERDKTERSYSLISYDSTHFAVLRFDKAFSYAETEVYGPDMKHLKTVVTAPDARKYGGVINLAGHLSMLYSRYEENKEKKCIEGVSLYALPLSRDSFLLSDDSTTLIAPFDMKSNFYRGNFAASPDRSKLLVYDYEEDGDIEEVKGLTNEITLRVYDQDLKLLWQRKVNLAPNPSGKRVMSIKKLRVNNAGEVAILTDFFRDHRSYTLKEVTADPTLFFVGADPKNFARFTPNLGELFFNQLEFSFDQEGNLIWFGFYSNQKYYRQAGYFFIKVNADRTRILQKKIAPFSQELLMKILGKNKLPAKVPELHHFELQYFRITPNGDLIVSAEYRPYSVHFAKSHDILVMRFSPDGELRWAKHIYNHNSYPEVLAPFLQHYLYIYNNEVYLLFNRGIYKDQGSLVAMRLNANGETTEKEVIKYLNLDEVLVPGISYPLADAKIFLGFQSRFFRFYRFGLLDLKRLFEGL